MTRTGKRLVTLMAVSLLAALFSLAAPQNADAATHTGTWHVAGGIINSTSVNTISYGTYSQAKTCVNIQSASRNDRAWTIRLIWYDAGANLVLWRLTGLGHGVWCSPWVYPSRLYAKFYDKITAEPLLSITGTYKIYTN